MTVFRISLLVVIASYLSFAQPATADQAEASAEPLPSLQVGMDLWAGYFPQVIAQQKGFYARRGISVDYQVLENTNAMMAQFLAGELDVVCLSLGDVFTLWQKMPGLKVVLVADLSAGGDALLSFKPIQQGLNGIRVGTNLGGFGELFVGQFIADYGANPKLVELVDVDAAQAPEKLRQGSVDIVHTWEPYVTALEQQGARIVYTSRQTPGLIPDVVVVHSKVLQERPEHVKQFIAGWLEAVDWWQRDEALGNRFLEQTLGLAQVSLRGIKLMDAKDNIETFREDGSPRGLVRVTERYSRFFFDKGVLTKPPTSKEILDGRFLP